jgi:hypothetical protein
MLGPVDVLGGAAHDLHVLLRHRLLRQPGGFERLSTEPECMKRTLFGQMILNLVNRPCRSQQQ